MRKATRISLALGTSAALLTLSAIPASADTKEVARPDAEGATAPAVIESHASVEVPSNPLSISLDNAPIAVPFEFKGIGEDTPAVLSIPTVTVTDLRAGVVDWAVSIDLGDFTGGAGVISTSEAVYAADNMSKSGTSTPYVVQRAAEAGGAEPLAVAGANGVKGNNMASWDATVGFMVPSDALAGEYSATLTYSLL